MTTGTTLARATVAALIAMGWALDASGQVAAAKRQSKGPVPSVTVKADDDKGLLGEAPVNTPDVPDPNDVSAVESPVSPSRGGGDAVRIKAETPVRVTLTQPVSSGAQRNGDMLAGVLAAPVRVSNGKVLKAGTPVKATVLSAAKAGQVQSAGVLSLQVVQVGSLPVTTDVLEFLGREGHRDVADANPEKGTEAMVPAGAPLTFQVLGSGDKPDSTEVTSMGATGRGGGQGSSVTVGPATVGAPGTPATKGSGFTRPAAGSTPATAIHGTTTPH